MASSREALLFYALWRDQDVRERLFLLLSKSDICKVRLANSACCNIITKRLFKRTHITFAANTFTKPYRIQALSRVGHHIEHLTFYFPHSKYTFMAPLIHPQTGQEVSFLYTPHTSMLSCMTRPKYNDNELGSILMQQYPPLFHAATNVPSFINALKFIPNMRHLTISCPGQDPQERYRRNMVDYALISLRISIEKVPLPKFHKLSLSSVHPAAFIYLRHAPGIGSGPSSTRRWSQINNLRVTVDSWDFCGPAPGFDHLKMLQDYLRGFAPNLEKLKFSWAGGFKGPCPLVLPIESHMLSGEDLGNKSPYALALECVAFRLPRLRYMEIRNAEMSAAQIRGIVRAHKHTVKEFDFDDVTLTGDGSWDEAMGTLYYDRSSGSHLIRSPDMSSIVPDLSHRSPSVAVQAASRRLMHATMGFAPSFNVEDDGDLAESRSPKMHTCANDALFIAGLTDKELPSIPPSPAKSSKCQRFLEELSPRRDRTKGLTFGQQSITYASDAPPPLFQDGSFKRSQKSPEPRFHFPLTPPRTPKSPQTPKPKGHGSPLVRSASVNTGLGASVPQAMTPALEVSPVQRNFAQEAAHQKLAVDPAMRTQALQRAREVVLQRMAREYQPPLSTRGESPARGAGEYGYGYDFGPSSPHAAVSGNAYEPSVATDASDTHSVLALDVAVGGCMADITMGRKFRQALFGPSTISVLSDYGAIESQSALVPLMLSRS
ncbi:hypothetical protein HOO65_011190 [Ceratocystis lukuohia]|uniref:F-box domain protein n=1 Tax=Ceratocystis lukuohia TaxID=2019550 RepID=A0ABR4MU68_9PEZI